MSNCYDCGFFSQFDRATYLSGAMQVDKQHTLSTTDLGDINSDLASIID